VTATLVTGAGQGIGEEICRAAARAGHRVGVLDRHPAAAQRVASDLDGAVPLVASVDDEAAVVAALGEFEGAVGPPDVVVNNAGVVRFGPLLELGEQQWRETLDTNLTGTFLVGRTAARHMAASGRDTGGVIVNLTSINGVLPGPNAGAYGPSKAAVALLTAQMALEFAPLGIRVNSIAPGFVDGGMSKPLYEDPATRELRTSAVPLGRLASPADVAGVVLWLASPEAGYLTGQNLVLDGGVTQSLLANLPRPASVDGSSGSRGEQP
jgi:NAD(P)-dependent dehydrogenase (short-subunit alcohol dehydrogenase family)